MVNDNCNNYFDGSEKVNNNVNENDSKENKDRNNMEIENKAT